MKKTKYQVLLSADTVKKLRGIREQHPTAYGEIIVYLQALADGTSRGDVFVESFRGASMYYAIIGEYQMMYTLGPSKVVKIALIDKLATKK
jgi:hypothetical protein